MTEKEILEAEKDYSEAKIQHTCVCWFRMTFPKVDRLLFSVPNGGWRGGRAGATMVYEGQVKGVADLILRRSEIVARISRAKRQRVCRLPRYNRVHNRRVPIPQSVPGVIY